MRGVPAGDLRIRSRRHRVLPGRGRGKTSAHHRIASRRIPPQMSAAQESAPIRAIDVIRKKRDGGELTRAEIEALVGGYTRGQIPDYQASAWLMATLLRGMSPAESAA